MDLTISTISALISLLISASATYNAYLLRGGKLAWSEALIALGMVSFTVSLAVGAFMSGSALVKVYRVTDILFILGFVFLFAASLKLRFALK